MTAIAFSGCSVPARSAAGGPARPDVWAGGAHLRLVPAPSPAAGGPARPDVWAGGAHLRLVPAPSPAAARLRLTRRGRLVRTLLVVALLALLGFGAVEAIAAGARPAVDHATTVRPGQTLSDVASEQLPTIAVESGVSLLRSVNALPSEEVFAGQSLLVPRP